MRLGVAGMMPGSLRDVDERLVRRIAELGFTGVGMHLTGDPHTVTSADIQQARAVLDDQEMRLVQFWGFYASLISPDETVRQSGVRTAQEIVRVGARMGAMMVGIRPTSLNPNGDWWPHPDNAAPATEERLVKSLREIVSACETHGVPISLECHVTTTLNSAESVKRVVEQTGPQWVRVTLDPVNFVGDLTTAYDNTPLLERLCDVLAPYIAAAHVKDVYVEDRHVVHISETIPGDGLLDFETFFRRFHALLPDGYAIIEHLPEGQVPQAAAFVKRTLSALGIPIAG